MDTGCIWTPPKCKPHHTTSWVVFLARDVQASEGFGSRRVLKNNLAVLRAIIMGIALINFAHEGLAKLKLRSHQSTRKYWNRKCHTFHIFCILACPVAFVDAWLNIQIPVTPCSSTLCRREILHFAYREFNTGNYNELPTQRGCTVDSSVMKCFPNLNHAY